jgi:hypothetical protein
MQLITLYQNLGLGAATTGSTGFEACGNGTYFVIPSEARNLSLIKTQEKRDSSARSAPRNDKIVSFSAFRSVCANSNKTA